MRIGLRLASVCLGAVLHVAGGPHAAPADENGRTARPYGIDERAAWTTSRIRGTPGPPAPYRTERVFSTLRFDEPLALTGAPGTDRLFVVERYGKIFSFADDPLSGGSAELFLDLGKPLFGLAFHPDFASNRYAYVTYILDGARPSPRGTRVSRFVATADVPPRCDPSTETVLLEWPSGGHNGGCLKFGPDGYLYVATGDASEIGDQRQTGQDISDLPGSVLRIDVDRPEGGRHYRIPADNPFVGVAGARPEIWAYGLRQLWKMSFDRATGTLWGGNVGQDLWEMVHVIERGGNYGWSVMEGSHFFRPERTRGPTPIQAPIAEHDHTVARSITGGFVYRGRRLEALAGAYIYGDYDTGQVWGLVYDGARVSWHERLADSSLRLVGFAEDRAGELYLLDHMGGGIHRLVPAPSEEVGGDFPRRLSDTGLFASTRDHTPAAGLIPYSITAPMWCDGAYKERFLALPGESRIEVDALVYPQPAPGAPPGWKFPDGTVLVETISLDTVRGASIHRRRVETRLLHHRRLSGSEEVGDQLWQGYTYLWNDDESDAVLVEDPQGLDRAYTVRDPAAKSGARRQIWHIPGRAECSVCHNMAAKYVLGVNTLQINRDHDYGGVVDNQLRTFDHIGVFTAPLSRPPEDLPRLVDWSDETRDLDRRARSYLHANCAHCHRKWGGGNAEFQLLYPLALEETAAVGVRPGQGTFEIAAAHIISPGDPYGSILFYRMAKLGSGRMPRLGSSVVDRAGLDLVERWIEELPRTPSASNAGSVARAEAEVDAALALLSLDDTAADVRDRVIDRLLASARGALRLSRAIDAKIVTDAVGAAAISRAVADAAPHVRDLFERFLPEEARPKRLGSAIDPGQILALAGEAARGERFVFETEGIQCKSCHQIRGKGTDVGPDLSDIGRKYDRAQLLEAILEPSKRIEERYLTYLAETKSGAVHSGLLVERGQKDVVLKDAQGELIRLSADDVELLLPQPQSLMPELLLRDMTARQVADLLAYLGTLKDASE